MKDKYKIVNEILELLEEAVSTLNEKDCDYVYSKIKLTIDNE